MDKITYRNFLRAKQEGRVCSHCGWMVNKENWKNGYRLCPSCYDALKGVNVSNPYGKWRDEPVDPIELMS